LDSKTTYDPAGNAVDVCRWEDGVTLGACLPAGTSPWTNPPTHSTSAAWDALNQRISVDDGTNGAAFAYDPDHNYQLAASYVPTASGKELQTLYGYDERHRVISVAHRLCTISSGHSCSATVDLGSSTYQYDDVDNVTQVIESATGAGSPPTRNYCYDARNQLVARNTNATCTATSGDETYAYDVVGNRTSAAGTSFTYNAEGQVATVAGAAVAYDAEGRITALPDGSGSGWRVTTYDAEGRVTESCDWVCSSGSTKLFSRYDADGHRTSLVVAGGGTSQETTFRYTGDAVIAEYLDGNLIRGFMADADGTILSMTIPSAPPGVSGWPTPGTYLVTWNAHGDALALLQVDAGTGTLTLANSFTYSTWGDPTTTVETGFTDLGFRYLYVGRHGVQWETESGLLLMGVRHYSPALGRFLQPDPPALEENLYAYVSNNPATRVDPTGTKELRGPGGAGSAGGVRPPPKPVKPTPRGGVSAGGRGGGPSTAWRGAALNRLLPKIRAGMCTTSARAAILSSGFWLIGLSRDHSAYLYTDDSGAQVRIKRVERGQWQLRMTALGGNDIDIQGRGNQPRSQTHINMRVC
jgi:RHS repeat-associated protein